MKSSSKIIRVRSSVSPSNQSSGIRRMPSNHALVNIGSTPHSSDSSPPRPGDTPVDSALTPNAFPSSRIGDASPLGNFVFVENLSKNQLAIGDAVLCHDYVGILKYIHPKFVGLELVQANGNCDGSLIDPHTGEIVRCFHTKPNHGIFVPGETIKRKISPLELLKKVSKQQEKNDKLSQDNRRLRRKYRSASRARRHESRSPSRPNAMEPSHPHHPSISPSFNDTLTTTTMDTHETMSSPESADPIQRGRHRHQLHENRPRGPPTPSLSTSFDFNVDMITSSPSVSQVSFGSLFADQLDSEVPRRKKKVKIRGSPSSKTANLLHPDTREHENRSSMSFSVSTESPSYYHQRFSFEDVPTSVNESNLNSAPAVYRQHSAPVVSPKLMKQAAPPPLHGFTSHFSKRLDGRRTPKAHSRQHTFTSPADRASVTLSEWTDSNYDAGSLQWETISQFDSPPQIQPQYARSRGHHTPQASHRLNAPSVFRIESSRSSDTV